MLTNLACLVAPILAVMALAACHATPKPDASLAPLTTDRDEPELALLDFALSRHFADESAAGSPTTCVLVSPEALSADQEAALLFRYPRLAPGARCDTDIPPPSDGFTGDRAVLLQLYDVQCDAARCTGWLARDGRPFEHYSMIYEGGSWRPSTKRISLP